MGNIVSVLVRVGVVKGELVEVGAAVAGIGFPVKTGWQALDASHSAREQTNQDILFIISFVLGVTVLGKMLGLVFLGASVGVFIALIVVLLSRAWIEVKCGKLKGTDFLLDKFMPVHSPVAIIGSDDFKADIALPDPDMAPQHERLKGAGSHFIIEDMSVGKGTFVNGRRVETGRLPNHASIRLGNTELVYLERRM